MRPILNLRAGLVCMEKIDGELANEVREMMFNEELRAVIRRNLFAIDSGDVGSKIAHDIKEYLAVESCNETKRVRL